MNPKIKELKLELSELYSNRDTFLLYHQDSPEFLDETIKRLESILQQMIIEELKPMFPHVLDSFGDIISSIRLDYADGQLLDINLSFRQSLAKEDNVNNSFSAENNGPTHFGNETYNKLLTSGEIIRYICANSEHPELQNLASRLNLTRESNKKSRAEAYKVLVTLYPYFIAVNMMEGPKRIIPVKMYKLADGLFKPIICKSAEEVIDGILRNTSGKNIRVFYSKVYDENDCIIS